VSRAVLFSAKTSFDERFYRSSFERSVEAATAAISAVYDALGLPSPTQSVIADLAEGLPDAHCFDYDLVDAMRLRFGKFDGARDSEDFANEHEAVGKVIELTESIIEACEAKVSALAP